MSQVKRLYVEKKPSYAVKAKELAEELKAYLSIDDVSNVRVLIRYDVENVSAETMEKAAVTVFSEPPVDDLYEEDFPKKEGDRTFRIFWNHDSEMPPVSGVSVLAANVYLRKYLYASLFKKYPYNKMDRYL